MATALAVLEPPAPPAALEAVLALALDTVTSPGTRRHYGRALAEFLGWRAVEALPFDRPAVHRWRALLLERGLAPSTINIRLSAVRKLAQEASRNGYLDAAQAASIEQVPNVRQSGRRSGNWLTLEQAQALLDRPSPITLKGKRDRAALALLVGCGLRRGEATRLTFEHIVLRDGRWVILDLAGKHGRIRTVPMPAWVKASIDRWSEAVDLTSGPVLRSLDQEFLGPSLSEPFVWQLVAGYGRQIGVALQPHDLRRTCAKLCRSRGGALEQIQLLLGHASIQTTELYLGTEQDLTNAPNDRLGLK